jgi:hypothetical protein
MFSVLLGRCERPTANLGCFQPDCGDFHFRRGKDSIQNGLDGRQSWLVAHWSFDEDFTSSVNNHLYGGMPRGEARLLIDRSHGAPRVGKGALRVSNAPGQGHCRFCGSSQRFRGWSGGGIIYHVRLGETPGRRWRWNGAQPFWMETFPTSSFAFGLHTVSGTRRARTWARAADLRVYSDSGGPSVGVGTWTHVALVWNGRDGYIRSYVQGKLAREWTVPKGSRLDPMRGMNIGADKFASPASGWDGWLDDFALFDVELTLSRSVLSWNRLVRWLQSRCRTSSSRYRSRARSS